ncbi:hypothetical protein CMQ_6852 [Grosmannia clavigera kw1407]|uniref:Uncharacterized protein n=1 Tax=Grosmannia clavigera (strain kw1407 / UAMH 11150) TaxID=655863 RepID=F0X7Z4_GROCL|nr:uncharacterized protein CMQ_6852 [Grosmannia clavigera kw1407]EFX06531.1 hypothetical protein CMQ_6852 [Grosmannia clavigera kw1407]
MACDGEDGLLGVGMVKTPLADIMPQVCLAVETGAGRFLISLRHFLPPAEACDNVQLADHSFPRRDIAPATSALARCTYVVRKKSSAPGKDAPAKQALLAANVRCFLYFPAWRMELYDVRYYTKSQVPTLLFSPSLFPHLLLPLLAAAVASFPYGPAKHLTWPSAEYE